MTKLVIRKVEENGKSYLLLGDVKAHPEPYLSWRDFILSTLKEIYVLYGTPSLGEVEKMITNRLADLLYFYVNEDEVITVEDFHETGYGTPIRGVQVSVNGTVHRFHNVDVLSQLKAIRRLVLYQRKEEKEMVRNSIVIRLALVAGYEN